MTIWETHSRRGLEHWSKRPKFVAGHDVFQGESCRAPQKRDRVIRRFTVKVIGCAKSIHGYPDTIKISPLK